MCKNWNFPVAGDVAPFTNCFNIGLNAEDGNSISRLSSLLAVQFLPKFDAVYTEQLWGLYNCIITIARAPRGQMQALRFLYICRKDSN